MLELLINSNSIVQYSQLSADTNVTNIQDYKGTSSYSEILIDQRLYKVNLRVT